MIEHQKTKFKFPEMLNTVRKGSFRDYEEEIDHRPEHQRNRSFSNRSEPPPLSSPIGFSKLLKRIEKRVKIDLEPKIPENNTKLQNQKQKELDDKQAQAQKRREERLKEFEKKSQILQKRHKKMKEKFNQEIPDVSALNKLVFDKIQSYYAQDSHIFGYNNVLDSKYTEDLSMLVAFRKRRIHRKEHVAEEAQVTGS